MGKSASFTLDGCDREAIGHVPTTDGITTDVRDRMVVYAAPPSGSPIVAAD